MSSRVPCLPFISGDKYDLSFKRAKKLHDTSRLHHPLISEDNWKEKSSEYNSFAEKNRKPESIDFHHMPAPPPKWCMQHIIDMVKDTENMLKKVPSFPLAASVDLEEPSAQQEQTLESFIPTIELPPSPPHPHSDRISKSLQKLTSLSIHDLEYFQVDPFPFIREESVEIHLSIHEVPEFPLELSALDPAGPLNDSIENFISELTDESRLCHEIVEFVVKDTPEKINSTDNNNNIIHDESVKSTNKNDADEMIQSESGEKQTSLNGGHEELAIPPQEDNKCSESNSHPTQYEDQIIKELEFVCTKSNKTYSPTETTTSKLIESVTNSSNSDEPTKKNIENLDKVQENKDERKEINNNIDLRMNEVTKSFKGHQESAEKCPEILSSQGDLVDKPSPGNVLMSLPRRNSSEVKGIQLNFPLMPFERHCSSKFVGVNSSMGTEAVTKSTTEVYLKENTISESMNIIEEDAPVKKSIEITLNEKGCSKRADKLLPMSDKEFFIVKDCLSNVQEGVNSLPNAVDNVYSSKEALIKNLEEGIGKDPDYCQSQLLSLLDKPITGHANKATNDQDKNLPFKKDNEYVDNIYFKLKDPPMIQPETHNDSRAKERDEQTLNKSVRGLSQDNSEYYIKNSFFVPDINGCNQRAEDPRRNNIFETNDCRKESEEDSTKYSVADLCNVSLGTDEAPSSGIRISNVLVQSKVLRRRPCTQVTTPVNTYFPKETHKISSSLDTNNFSPYFMPKQKAHVNDDGKKKPLRRTEVPFSLNTSQLMKRMRYSQNNSDKTPVKAVVTQENWSPYFSEKEKRSEEKIKEEVQTKDPLGLKRKMKRTKVFPTLNF